MRVVKTSIPWLVARRQRELHARSFGPADPVPLHHQDLLGPVAEPVRCFQQLVGVLRDAEEPLLQVARGHHRAAAPAFAVDDLLVGEHGLAARTPVDVRALAIRQVALEHLQEQPLVPAVVLRLAGGQLALPGVADADALELAFHVGDVLERPGFGMRSALDGGVLRGHPERVPPERVQDVVAAHALHARDHVADHVVADVADVRVARRVREHLQTIELRPIGILRHLEGARLPPARLPFLLDCLGFVVRHDLSIISHARTAPGPRGPPRAPARRVRCLSPLHPRLEGQAPWIPAPHRSSQTTPRGRQRAPEARNLPR